MLKELRVKNYAIIDELSVEFEPGLNVLTGETGAGKSIIIGALGIALGQRAYTEMIKSGAEEATVEAFFDVEAPPILQEMGIEAPDGIIIKRVLSRSGKTKAYVNNSLVNIQSLNALGKVLVDVHGQHEHQSLLSAENQLNLLDHFGKLLGVREEVTKAYSDAESLSRKIESIKANARASEQKLELLQYQANEIESASLEDGEDAKLEEERSILANLTRLRELSEGAYDDIYGAEGSALERLSRAAAALKEVAAIDNGVQEVLEVIEQALALTEDASHSLRSHKDKYDADPARLEAVDDRLELIGKLKKKYGDSIADIRSFLANVKEDLEAIETSSESVEEMEKELQEKRKKLDSLCSELTEKRRKASSSLETSVLDVLKDLALEKADFKVYMRPAPVSSSGADDVEFLFSANKGEQPKSLTKVASGGELSRIMLAIKSVLRGADEIPVLVFDEVDAGIGGKTAHNVAQKLKETSKDHQVLLITHLPQIASVADMHAHILKESKGKGVTVTLKRLTGKERQEEIARMLSGHVTDTSLEHAREILGKGGGKSARR